ncbi:putative tetratricopeptide-like helical domain superfamily [Dioscorea sansibarensis]
MLAAPVLPNSIISCADFSSNCSSVPLGLSIHARFKCCSDSVFNDVVLGTSLVDMYSKCGQIELARRVFDEMPAKNSVTFNISTDGYMRCREVEQGISVFRQMEMQGDNVELDYVTVTAVLTVCANLGALGQALWMHSLAMRRGFHDNVRLENSLIDMYSRDADVWILLFRFSARWERKIRCQTWNTMVVGFDTNGCLTDALEDRI